MKRLLWILPLLLLFSCNNYRASRGPADWIYVSQTGNDGTGDGTSGAPYATVSFACTQASSGDTIYVNPGTITETAQVVVPVGVSIYGAGETSIIKSTVTGTSYTHNTLSLSSAEGTNGSQSISYIKIDGDSETGFGAIYIAGRSNVIIHHCTIVDFDNNGVIFNGITSTGEPTTHATGNSFHDNYVENCSGYTTEFRWLLAFNGQDGFSAYNNTLIQNSRIVGNNGCCIKCVEGFDKNCKIYDNYIECDDASADLWGFAIETWNQQNMEIYDNTIKGIVDIAGYTSSDISVHDNIIGWDAPLAINSFGMIIECNVLHDGIYVYNNVIKNVNIGIIFYPTVNEETLTDINIYYNLIYNIGKAADGWTNSYGISGYTGGRTGWTINGLNIYNNVIKSYVRAGSSRTSGIALWNEVGATFEDVDITNNIIQSWDYACISDLYLGDIDTIRISNNVSYGNANNNDTRFDVTPSVYTAVAHIKSDPLFVSTSDLRLQPTSPAIDAGIDVSAITGGLDFLGASLYGAAYDIGAFEYQGTGRGLLIIDDKIATINYKIPLIEH